MNLTITSVLTWADLKRFGKQDNAGRWYPNDDVADYFTHIRAPSRAWPNSYAKAAMTKKFMNWYNANNTSGIGT